jgi:chemotaxis protein MotA
MASSPTSVPKPKSRPDFATLGGLVLSFGGILGGLLLEGGDIRDVAQITAAMIVLGGTLGAVLVTTPISVAMQAARKMKTLFFDSSPPLQAAIDDIIGFATKARKHGLVSLEQEADQVADPFLKKALNLAVDGTDLEAIRNMMEIEISLEESRGEAEAKVFEAAGGYAPTVGIIGAVLGLIQVMKHLENIEEVGRGIAVAFVATVYGVGSANLFFLPAAYKLRARLHRSIQIKELLLEGVLSIIEGLNPKLIRVKLDAYTRSDAAVKKPGRAPAVKVQNPAAERAPLEG